MAKPAFKLVVCEAFLTYKRGDQITDPKEIETVLAEYPQHVVKVAL